ncbi:trypsin-like serine peptidase [Kitasatospora sp. NPDC050543]|uniref:trypsin-like serine peptidase n=1 Tax=Kitasatospora sp. NPDC050543 TaxID=3364054 RepID=UPI0037BC918D
MSSISRVTRAALGASVAALTLVAATGCGPDNSSQDIADPAPATTAATTATATPAASASATKPGGPIPQLPSLDELKKWKFDDWDKWAQKNIITPAVKGYWDIQRMLNAKPPAQAPVTPPSPTAKPSTKPGDDGNDPMPTPIDAKAEAHPYTKQLHVDGKIFFEANGKDYVCSGTVISDPAHPGKSNLVWTAGHCAHDGKGAGFHQNIVFAPAFNSTATLSGGKKGTIEQAEPYGEWGTVDAVTSPQWSAEADIHTPNSAAHYDFAILKVANPAAGGKSLEETVGGSVPVWFNAPREQVSITAYGFPAGKPYDGAELERCDSGKPSRFSMDPARPSMYAIGCTSTGGSSGGGWFSNRDGKPALVSNTSVGNDAGWQTGPYLDDVAAHALDYLSKKK